MSQDNNQGAPATPLPAKQSLQTSSTTPPFVNSASTSLPEDHGLPPCQSPRRSPPHLTTPDPGAAQLTTPGPRAALTHTSTDLGSRQLRTAASSTSTPSAPSARTSDHFAPLPVSSIFTSPKLGCDHDKVQSEEVGLSLAPKE